MQVYDREVDECSEFIMSAYDADVSYDFKTKKYRVLFLQLVSPRGSLR